jgi:phosphoglycolate phosphatase-like HAD superfamily hydrolase
MPGAFTEWHQIVCVDRDSAIALAAAYEDRPEQAEKLLSRLAEHGVCERAVFSGKPTVDVYIAEQIDKLRELHVFEVEVTKGQVLNGKRRAFMLLYLLQDNKV